MFFKLGSANCNRVLLIFKDIFEFLALFHFKEYDYATEIYFMKILFMADYIWSLLHFC